MQLSQGWYPSAWVTKSITIYNKLYKIMTNNHKKKMYLNPDSRLITITL